MNYETLKLSSAKVSKFISSKLISTIKNFKQGHFVIFASTKNRILYKRQVAASLPSKWGSFTIIAYGSNHEEKLPHLALVHSLTDFSASVPVRIHSECITGDLFGSMRCDCGDQFTESMRIIEQSGGVMLYLRQEGRGIGLINKLEAYNLQDKGYDTIEANVHLGFEPDERDFDVAIQILKDLGITSIDLITNNPDKILAIDQSSITLNKRIPIVIPSKAENAHYLKVKQDVMGHLL